MKIVVSQVKGGWSVHDGVAMGPFPSRQRALDLAEGIVKSLRDHGETVELVVKDGAAQPLDE